MVKTLGIEQFAPMNHIYRFYELNDYMKSIAEIGYHSMDLWTCGSHYFVDSNNYEDTKYIKKLMSQYDIRIVSITPRQSCPNPFHMAVKKTELREKAKQYFLDKLLEKKFKDQSIKALLLDGNVFCGCGNIYDCEVLYRKRIHRS